MSGEQSERRLNCILHAEKLSKFEKFIDKMDLWMLGNGDPKKGVLFKLDQVMNYMLDAKQRRIDTERFRRNIIITVVLTIISCAVTFGTLMANVEDNKNEIKELRKK